MAAAARTRLADIDSPTVRCSTALSIFICCLLHVLPEIFEQLGFIHICIRHLSFAYMPMVTFAALVVVADHPLAVPYKHQPVFEWMPGWWNRIGHSPDNHFDDATGIS